MTRFPLAFVLTLSAWAASPEALADKIFPALKLLRASPEIRAIRMDRDPSVKWTEAQITEAEYRLHALHVESMAIRHLAGDTLPASHVAERHAKLPSQELLAAVFREAAIAMNRVIDVYQLGEAPRYPLIDGPAQDVKSPAYLRMIEIGKKIIASEARADDAFFSGSVRYAVLLLELNRRDEAIRFEPMELGENRAAVERARGNVGGKMGGEYPYSAIVVPGAGSDRPGVPLSPYGKLRLRVAAARFHARQAPFVIVSGGFVHPNQTPFNEAFEMKKSLVEDFQVPAEAVIIDPHARHTTTNIRNAARLIYRYGLGFDKTALIVTDPGQSAYIENANFVKRCLDEMRLVPFAALKRISEFDLEFGPTIESLHVDALDPLDP
jgi:hypothetical protein